MYLLALNWKVNKNYVYSHNNIMNYKFLKLLELLKILKLMLPSRIAEISQWWWPRSCYVFWFLYT